jgi:DNA-binding transcriptional regulator GbsR (MarR family)
LHGLVELLGFIGLPRVAAAALAVLLYEDRGLTLTELVHRTGYAKSHLSTYLRTLAANGLVEYVRSGRHIIYRARRNAVVLLLKNYLESLKHRVEYASSNLNDYELSSLFKKLSQSLSQILEELEASSRV